MTGAALSSTETGDYAWDCGDGWQVSWLPGRVLSRDAAITALMLAELYARAWNVADSKRWKLARVWEAEIGIDERYRPS